MKKPMTTKDKGDGKKTPPQFPAKKAAPMKAITPRQGPRIAGNQYEEEDGGGY